MTRLEHITLAILVATLVAISFVMILKIIMEAAI